MSDLRWHFERAGQLVGPFLSQDLRQLATAGIIQLDTILVDSDGNHVLAANSIAFESAVQDSELVLLMTDTVDPRATIFVGPPPPLPPPPPPPPPPPNYSAYGSVNQHKTAVPLAPWNPVAIARFGILFSPFWAIAMSALNRQRLGMDASILRPFVFCTVAWGVDLFIYLCVYKSYLLHLMFYLLSIVVIVHMDLSPQRIPYDRHKNSGKPIGGWGIPILSGLPGFAVVLLAFLIPLSISAEADAYERQTRKSVVGGKYEPPAWIKNMPVNYKKSFADLHEAAGQTGINLVLTALAFWLTLGVCSLEYDGPPQCETESP